MTLKLVPNEPIETRYLKNETGRGRTDQRQYQPAEAIEQQTETITTSAKTRKLKNSKNARLHRYVQLVEKLNYRQRNCFNQG